MIILKIYLTQIHIIQVLYHISKIVKIKNLEGYFFLMKLLYLFLMDYIFTLALCNRTVLNWFPI